MVTTLTFTCTVAAGVLGAAAGAFCVRAYGDDAKLRHATEIKWRVLKIVPAVGNKRRPARGEEIKFVIRYASGASAPEPTG